MCIISYPTLIVYYLFEVLAIQSVWGNKRKSAAGAASERGMRKLWDKQVCNQCRSSRQILKEATAHGEFLQVQALGWSCSSWRGAQDGACDLSGTLVLGAPCWSSPFLKDCTLWYGSPLDNRGGARRMEQERQSIMDSTVLLKEEWRRSWEQSSPFWGEGKGAFSFNSHCPTLIFDL